MPYLEEPHEIFATAEYKQVQVDRGSKGSALRATVDTSCSCTFWPSKGWRSPRCCGIEALLHVVYRPYHSRISRLETMTRTDQEMR